MTRDRSKLRLLPHILRFAERVAPRAVFDGLRENGEIIDFIKTDYRRDVMASMKWTNEWTRDAGNFEYLFLLEK